MGRNFDNIWDGMGGFMATLTEQITGQGDYGCWCHFASNNGYVGNGFGAPVDAMDGLCKNLHDQYACIEVEDPACDPWTGAFTFFSHFTANDIDSKTDAEIESACNAFNGGHCQRWACIVETSFFRDYLSGVYLSVQTGFYGHPIFDAATQCD